MLSWVDGEASVEDLTLAAGLKQEHAFRALLVAKLLGVIEVKPPEKPAPVVSGDLDIRRLEAKYDEVQEADYFSILGLSRSASSDDVQRAFRRLAEEFDPIKYTGHPDASLQQRAQVVSTLIEEAARALEDERRRAAIRAAACAIHCAHLPRQYGRTTRERFARFYRAERQTLTSMKP